MLDSDDRKEKVGVRRKSAGSVNVAPLLPGRHVTCDAIPDAESCDDAKTDYRQWLLIGPWRCSVISRFWTSSSGLLRLSNHEPLIIDSLATAFVEFVNSLVLLIQAIDRLFVALCLYSTT